jgi:hypothetical protein
MPNLTYFIIIVIQTQKSNAESLFFQEYLNFDPSTTFFTFLFSLLYHFLIGNCRKRKKWKKAEDGKWKVDDLGKIILFDQVLTRPDGIVRLYQAFCAGSARAGRTKIN